MSYIGSTPTTQSFIAGTDYFNGTGSAVSFTLSRAVNSVNDIEVIVNNVEQIPSGYSVSGTTLTFSVAPSAGTSNVYVRYLSTTNLSLAIPSGTSATFNTVTATNLTVTNDATINGVKVGEGGGSIATNTAVGASALAANTSGSSNTAIGGVALSSNTTGGNNTALGYNSSSAITTGIDNVSVGYNSLSTNITGSNNTAVGRRALFTATASDNTAVGYYALTYTTTGTANTAVGRDALQANTTASNNTALGYQAGYSTATGSQNTYLGTYAGYSTLVGVRCAYVGYSAGPNNGNTPAANSDNNSMGVESLWGITSGSFNTALGNYALRNNTTASNNTAVGYQAGYSNTTGYNNTIVGQGAGYNLTTGYRNTLIGVAAGADSGSTYLVTGYQNIIIGWACDTSNTNGINQIVLGADATGKGDNTGFINAGGGGVYQGNNSSSWSTTSDRRLKKNIVDNTDGLNKIAAIRVRNFEYRLPEEITELDPSCAVTNTGVQLGVIAQELQQILPECVKTESTGVMSVDTDNLTWYLVNAIQEQQALITALTTRITALENNNATQ
jgi:hypothetical protein